MNLLATAQDSPESPNILGQLKSRCTVSVIRKKLIQPLGEQFICTYLQIFMQTPIRHAVKLWTECKTREPLNN